MRMANPLTIKGAKFTAIYGFCKAFNSALPPVGFGLLPGDRPQPATDKQISKRPQRPPTFNLRCLTAYFGIVPEERIQRLLAEPVEIRG
jgi:hypothetical protein